MQPGERLRAVYKPPMCFDFFERFRLGQEEPGQHYLLMKKVAWAGSATRSYTSAWGEGAKQVDYAPPNSCREADGVGEPHAVFPNEDRTRGLV
jgi:hypothetical protein